jgi:hypothetical protein
VSSGGSTQPVEWFDSAERYAEVAAGAQRRSIPILRPPGARKRALWERVTASMVWRGEPATHAGQRFLIAWGERPRPAAQVYARWSGSVWKSCGTLEEALRLLRGCVESSVMLFAETSMLTHAVVAQFSAAARQAGKTLGLLCGRSEAGFSFSVAKMLSQSALPPGGHLLDAPHHEQRGGMTDPAKVVETLLEPSAFKVIRCHGEGSHAKLPGVVICGLTDEHEFPEAPDDGCSRDAGRCKRAGSRGARVVPGEAVAASVVAFACCNGFNVAAELFPSSVSMAVSFAEGWAAALIAPVRALVVPDAVLERLHRGLTAGEPLGEIVAAVNVMSQRLCQGDAFVLHGDPLHALAPRETSRPSDARSENDTQGGAPEKLARLQSWLVEVLQSSARAHRLMTSAEVWAGEPHESFIALGELLGRTERQALNGLKWAEAEPRGDSATALLRSGTAIRIALSEWDKRVGPALMDRRRRLDVFDLGHYDQVLIDMKEGPPCLRCGSAIEVHHFGRGLPIDGQRCAELCRVCGPISEFRMRGLRLSSGAIAREAAPGETLVFALLVHAPDGLTPLLPTARLLIRLYDKARDTCVSEQTLNIEAKSQHLSCRLDLPEDLETELHSIHVMAACGLDTTYLRLRFACLPAGRRGAPAPQ